MKTFTKDGLVSAYGLACGVEQRAIMSDGTPAMIYQHASTDFYVIRTVCRGRWVEDSRQRLINARREIVKRGGRFIDPDNATAWSDALTKVHA